MTNTERISANNAELRVAISMAESISGGASAGVIEPLSITENGTYTAPEGVDGYSPVEVNVPMPEGTLEITANGLYPVAQYAEVDVSVHAPEGDTLAEFLSLRNGKYLFYEQRNLTEIPLFDTSDITDMSNMFYNCTNLTAVPLFNTSKVTNMDSMFRGCSKLTSGPLFNTSKVTDMSSMFQSCSTLTEVPLFDTSEVTDMSSMFSGCTKITSIPLFNTSKVTAMTQMFGTCYALTTIPLLDTSKITNMNYMFQSCKALTTVPALDARGVGYFNTTFSGCTNIKDIGIRNIKTNLQVSDGTSYGHLLTVDSLVHLIYELRRQFSARTLTIGSVNLEKLADVYVKAVDITDEMRAEDDLIDEKYPFVVCDSTDEGAMLITTYASTIKNWTIK